MSNCQVPSSLDYSITTMTFVDLNKLKKDQNYSYLTILAFS